MNMILEKVFTAIVQNEGKKFLELSPGFDEAVHHDPFRNAKIASLYVHIPYCKVLCPYCSFNRYLYQEEQAIEYFKALKTEAELFYHLGYRFTHVYMGGGTPTINMRLLEEFFIYIKTLFPVQQISMETNPTDLTIESVATLKKMGVNRLSIGVQSFDDNMLIQMGRFSHNATLAKERIQLAKGHFETVNIDLMFNFPSQTVDSFLGDLQMFQELDIDQVTFYPLMPSPHKKSKLEKQFNAIKTNREYKFYELILERLLPQYHISTVWCFSKGEKMIDEYIVEYEDYVGIGAGSVSFIDGTFLVNTFSPEKYIQTLDNKKLPVTLSKKSTPRDHARYVMLTQLFGMKMNLNAYHKKFHHTLFWELLSLRLLGLIKKEGAYMVTTRKGMYFVGIMMKNFFSTLNHLREYCIEQKI
jgi:coproporphyrinogen III oxidase-like Fe-S oxidoreductase